MKEICPQQQKGASYSQLSGSSEDNNKLTEELDTDFGNFDEVFFWKFGHVFPTKMYIYTLNYFYQRSCVGSVAGL